MTRFQRLFERATARNEYWIARAKLNFNEELARLMAAEDVSRAELARRLATSPAYVTKILRGDANFTLSSMVRIARALGAELRVHLAAESASTRWYDVVEGGEGAGSAYRAWSVGRARGGRVISAAAPEAVHLPEHQFRLKHAGAKEPNGGVIPPAAA